MVHVWSTLIGSVTQGPITPKSRAGARSSGPSSSCLINPSAWKGYSAKFACIGFSEVRNIKRRRSNRKTQGNSPSGGCTDPHHTATLALSS